jgi:hypothetical protein
MDSVEFKVGNGIIYASSLKPDHRALFFQPARAYNNVEYGGRGRIWGHVFVVVDGNDTPVSRRVTLHRQRDGKLISSIWSDPESGYYEFPGLRTDIKYYILSFDHTGAFGGVIGDNVEAT